MLLTVVVIGVLIGGLAFGLALWAGLLWLGARLARIPDVGFKRALVAALVLSAIGAIAQIVVTAIDGEDRRPVVGVAVYLASMVGTWKAVQHVFRTTFGRAALAWLPTLLGVPASLLLAWFVVQPLLFETYVVPTNAMAPTILGEHFLAACPQCGGEVVLPAAARELGREMELGICRQCWQSSVVPVSQGEALGGDCIIAFKMLQPRRWGPVVFQAPADPSTVYVDRLVGLPGEEVAIRDGEVWIDGKVAAKPKELAALQYVGPADLRSGKDEPEEEWGPVPLGDDEYLVLGDFSRRSNDARYWTVGAPGHAEYAVPESHLVGVVTHIYWPLSRWRVFR